MAEKKIPLSISQKSAADVKKDYKIGGLKLSRQRIKKAALIVAVPLALVVLVFTGIMVSYLIGTPKLDPAALEAVEASYIFDRKDREVVQLHAAENRIVLPIEEIPEQVQEAFIAIEDERFRKHRGFDIIGFGRAIVVNIRERSFSQGASTITQQLIRNTLLGQEKTIKRKVQEMWLAIRLERIKSKDEIMEMYLNRICFGNAVYGVEAASLAYFNKSVNKLDLAETALLAGIVRSPAYYNPFNDKKAAISRMKLVLGNMKRLNFITQEEHDQAISKKMKFAKSTVLTYPYPYFIDYVIHHELVKILEDMPEYGTQETAYEAIYNGGLRVYTTMHQKYQKQMEKVINRTDLYPQTTYINMEKLKKAIDKNNGKIPSDYPQAYIDSKKGIPQPQAAMVLADPKEGQIWALGGGREYSKNRNELLRYLSLRQPGSAIKPIINYGPSFNEGLLGAGSVLDDAPLAFPGWYPENVDSAFWGLVSVRQALAHSRNVPAVRTYTEHIGQEKGAEMAYQMGLSTYNPREATPDSSWGLGSRESTALDMAQAYSVLANNGVKMELHTVRRIEDRDGEVIYEHKADPEQILSKEAAFITTDILQDVVTSTTATGLLGLGRPLAAKTGTTDDSRDIYLASYTPNLVSIFWMGFDIKDSGQIQSGWRVSTGMVKELLRGVFETLPQENFAGPPPGVVRVNVCTKSGLLPGKHCSEAGTVKADYFLRNHVPRLTCDKHVELEICKASKLLAGEFCPEKQVVKKVFFDRPEFIVTDGRWVRGAGRGPRDAKETPPEDLCDLHTERSGEFTAFNASPLGGGQVALSWRYRGGTAKEFKLYRQEKNGKRQLIKTLAGRTTTYTDTQLAAGATYSYTIYAFDEQGVRSEPAKVEITIQDSSSEQQSPPNLKAKLYEGDSVSLTWVYTGMASGFNIYRNGKRIDQLSSWRFQYTDDELEPGTYTYYVTAESQGSESKPSNSVEVTINGDTDSAGKKQNSTRSPGEGLHRLLTACWSRICLLF